MGRRCDVPKEVDSGDGMQHQTKVTVRTSKQKRPCKPDDV